MAKVATVFLDTDPWIVRETGFHEERAIVAESIFSLGNEFMGVRGYFEEGYSGDHLIGSFFNGVFEYIDTYNLFKGPIRESHIMVNSVDWLFTRLVLDGEQLDLATARFRDFTRSIDLREGVYRRSFVWITPKGKELRLTFERFTSMLDAPLGMQRIGLEALNFNGTVHIEMGLDFSTHHHDVIDRNAWPIVRSGRDGLTLAIMGSTERSQHRVMSTMRLSGVGGEAETVEDHQYIGYRFALPLRRNQPRHIERCVVNSTERDAERPDGAVWQRGLAAARDRAHVTWDAACGAHAETWQQVWETLDVTIDGDPANQQGVRFGIFQLHQTYHGVDPSLNIAAKGLTGEVYWGHTWWDSETYCQPFYMFNNPQASRNLLMYRYNTMPMAIKRAHQKDCEGARFPMCSITGMEGCWVWQHGDLEIHVSAAVAYSIWHYLRVTDDRAFLYDYGIEMLLQIARYYASRGAFNQLTGEFGFWGVMGPDEFHMMVHNNCYTNVLGKKCFEWALEAMDEMRERAPTQLAAACERVGLREGEAERWRELAEKMAIPQNAETGVFEQHDGYFEMPHTDCAAIPPEEFPIYENWAYYRIFRTDMIKQPDVLLLHFFFSQEYSDANKAANYDFYEPRCSHESSLSPSIHSILAAELGRHQEAFDFWGHSARLDLDDYNRNTRQGLHTTSMAAAWMNVVYGFGGMRSDGERLSFKPSLPARWNAFSFRIVYRGSVLEVRIDRDYATFTVSEGGMVVIDVFGQTVTADADGARVIMPADRLG